MIKYFFYMWVISFCTNAFAFFETENEKVKNFMQEHAKSDALLKDLLVNEVFIPPYKSNAVYQKAIRLCRSGVFSDPYTLGMGKLLMRNEFLGYAASSGSLTGSLIKNSGGINQLFNSVEYDVVMLNTYKNDNSSRKVANALFNKDTGSLQAKKVSKWMEEIFNKEDKTEAIVFQACFQVEMLNTILKEGNGLFKEELKTVRFQIHNQESGRTKTLLAN